MQIQAAVETGDAGNTITLSPDLVKAVNELVANKGVCYTPGKEKRVPPTFAPDPVRVSACHERRVQSMLRQMQFGGPFNSLVVAVRNGNRVIQGVNIVHDEMVRLYAYAAGLTSLRWVSAPNFSRLHIKSQGLWRHLRT